MAWVASAIAIGGTLIGASSSRSATSAASDSNAQAIAAQERATTERLNFDKQVYSDGADDRKWISERARKVSDYQDQDREKYNALQDEQIARGRKYQGVEDRILADAESFDTEAKREELAGKAKADVQQSYASAAGQYFRNISRMGINPDSGRADAARVSYDLSKAGALAFAGNKARTDASTLGYARKMDAVALGKGLVGNQATQANLQLASGDASVRNGQVPLTVQGNANNAMSNGYGNAANGYSNVANNQQRSFTMAGTYGAGVGNDVGNMFGNLSRNPAVVNGIRNWFTPNPTSTYGQPGDIRFNGNGGSGD